MANIDNITTEDFKTLFARDLPFVPVYDENKTYFKDDVVYLAPNFYKSLVCCNNLSPESGANWICINESIDNYITDRDIERAFREAKVNFNPNLFHDDETAKMVFCYLAAHYLMVDLNNASNPLALGFMGFTQSKSVGSVSESYGIPQWMLSSKTLSLYAQTGYGRKYLSLIQPLLIGNVMFFTGRTTNG